jgi:kexin
MPRATKLNIYFKLHETKMKNKSIFNFILLSKACLLTPLVFLSPSAASLTTWDATRPNELNIERLVLGNQQYNNIVIQFGELKGFSTAGPSRTYDRFDAKTGELTIATLSINGQSFYDVRVTVAGLVSVDSSSFITEFIPDDPLFLSQWHLKNSGQSGQNMVPAKSGEDLNISRAWQIATGTGIRIAVVDDGLDIRHEDLRTVTGKHWDYRVNAYGDPSSDSSSHGTACAGLAAAKGNNGIGVTGTAFNASLVGYNLLAASTGMFGADAVIKDLDHNHIYTNSYGAPDGTGTIASTDHAWRTAIDTGVTSGRQGKGAVYIWAAGNGAPVDRSDYDSQANYHGVMAVGALNDQGTSAAYSEPGSNILISAYGGESCDGHTITTSDVSGSGGYNNGTGFQDYAGQPNYTRCMNGTSAAAPQVAGVAGLLLEANPALTWRDIRAIFARTARKTDPGHSDWLNNGAGLAVNHHYGFGALDAFSALLATGNWTNLPAQKSATAHAAIPSPLAIPDNGSALQSGVGLSNTGISKVEFVELTVASDHSNFGDLEITLTSPSGTTSTLSKTHQCIGNFGSPISCGSSLESGHTFGVVRYMDESADGQWILNIQDKSTGETGTLTAWSIKVFGH